MKRQEFIYAIIPLGFYRIDNTHFSNGKKTVIVGGLSTNIQMNWRIHGKSFEEMLKILKGEQHDSTYA